MALTKIVLPSTGLPGVTQYLAALGAGATTADSWSATNVAATDLASLAADGTLVLLGPAATAAGGVAASFEIDASSYTGTITALTNTASFTTGSITVKTGGGTVVITGNQLANVTKATGANGLLTVNATAGAEVSSGSVNFTGTPTGNILAGTKTIDLTAGAIAGTISVNNTGVISGVTFTDSISVRDAGTATTTINTVANLTAGGMITVNGDAITFAANAAETDGVVITANAASAGGIANISGVATGGVLTWGAATASRTITVNNKAYAFTADTVAPVIASTGNASSLSTGKVTISSTGNNSVTTTYEGGISISGGSAAVQATAGTASAVTDLTAGASLTAKYGTGLTVATVAGTRESSTYTVNDLTFTQGFSAANATTAMTFKTTTNGATLINGSAYLNGSGTVVVSNVAGTTSSTVASTNGDITITVNAGVFEIGDLDNGDSFTVTVGTDKRTYTVSNGKLVDSLGNVSTNGFNAADSTYGSVLAISGITAGTVFAADGTGLTGTAAAIASNTNLNSSHGDLATASDVTGRSLGISTVAGSGATTTAAMRTVTEYASGSYVHGNGLVDSNGSDAIGTLNSTSDYYTYVATGNAGQTIDLNNALAVTGAADGGTWQITGTNAADYIIGNGQASTLNGGAGKDTVSAGAGDFALGGDGDDSLVGAGNNASLLGGAGADTLYATAGLTGVSLAGGEGADVFVLNDGVAARTGIITDYNLAEDVLLVGNATFTEANMKALAATPAVFTDAGVLTVNTGTATVNGSNGSYQVMIQNTDKKKELIGWVGDGATSVDFTAQSTSAILFGTQNTAGDSLYGGTGDDTILAGSGDTVWGGSGSNRIDLSNATEAVVYGFGVESGSKKEKDTVVGFTTGFDTEASDSILLVGDTSNLATTLTGGTLTVKMGSSELSMAAGKGSSGAAEVLFGTSKAAFIDSAGTATVDSASYADYYYGSKSGSVGSGLSFAKAEDDVNIDLSNTTNYRNITSLTGGTGNSTLMGSSAKETLISAGGNTSLWGGAGADVLVGASNAKDAFFLTNGSGKDTVSSFAAYTEATADTADVIFASDLSSAKAVSGAVELATSDGSKFTLSGLTNNSEIQYTTDGNSVAIAKVGSVSAANSFTYASEVNFYGGGSKVDTLTVSDSDNHQIWLDNSKGGSVTYSSIEVVNGQNAQGDLLIAGNDSANTITAGRGDASLWGGSGSAKDYLKGSTNGTTQFFYGYGEGNDTIVSSNADDVVNLLNITLANINGAATEITSSGVTLGMNDGSKLTVQTTKDITFSLADGSKYTANHNDKSWS